MDIVREEELSSFRAFQFAGNCNKSFDRNLRNFIERRFVVGLRTSVVSLRVSFKGNLRASIKHKERGPFYGEEYNCTVG